MSALSGTLVKLTKKDITSNTTIVEDKMIR